MKRIYSIAAVVVLALIGLDAFAQSQRMVLIEKGSNASCAPCAAQNPGFHSMLNTVDDKHIGLNYQWYFPGYDPMNEHNPTEANARFATYYGNNGVPTAMIDGVVPTNAYPGFNAGYAGAPAGFSAQMINDRYAVSSPFDIDIEYTVTPSSVTAEVTVTCTEAITANNLRLRIAVIERVISFDSPPGTNGESTFYNVMKKFMPNTAGLNLQNSWVPGDSQSFTQSWSHQNVYDFNQLSVVAFVQNDANKSVLQAARADGAVFESSATNAASIFGLGAPSDICSGTNTISPQVTIRNTGNADLTAASITAEINGVEGIYNWSGNLPLMGEEVVQLDPISFEAQAGTNTLNVTVTTANNENNEEVTNTVSAGIALAPSAGSGVLVTVVTDNYGDETYWRILDGSGVKIAEGGNTNVENNYGTGTFPPAPSPGMYGNNTTNNHEVEFETDGCFTFEIFDYFGDGVCCQYGQGSYTVRNLATNQILLQGGNFQDKEDGKFESMITSISENDLATGLKIYPNPVVNEATLELSLSESTRLTIDLYDLTGKLVYSRDFGMQPAGEFVTRLQFNEVSNGLYLLNLRAGEAATTRKISVNK